MLKRTGLLLLTLAGLTGCPRPQVAPLPTSTPTATPSPTPNAKPSATPRPPSVPDLPRKPADMARLFNGVTFRSTFEAPQSTELASLARTEDGTYQVEVKVTATLPRPSQTIEDLASNDPKLPLVLNQMTTLVANAKVSPFFEKIYKLKIDSIKSDLYDLESVLSRHNFYDCETILELQNPGSGRKALLMIGDMDINTDGSDGDRNIATDGASRFFQPQTSYRWPRQTDRQNPFLDQWQNKLASLKKEFGEAGLSKARNAELKSAIEETNRTVNDLKRYSFLVSSTDPSIVMPSFMLNDTTDPFAPKIGDYVAVIYDGVVYPAIVGDAGPSAKMGEASLRLGKQINSKASAIGRPVNGLKVSYLVFPGTAEPGAPPDLTKWHDMVKKYLDEIGGTAPEIFVWENTVPPWPTPTPTPTPSPSPTPTPEPAPSASPGGTTPAPSASPAPTIDPNTLVETGGKSPAPTPSVSPTPNATVSPSPSPTVTPVPMPEIETNPRPSATPSPTAPATL